MLRCESVGLGGGAGVGVRGGILPPLEVLRFRLQVRDRILAATDEAPSEVSRIHQTRNIESISQLHATTRRSNCRELRKRGTPPDAFVPGRSTRRQSALVLRRRRIYGDDFIENV